MVIIFDKNIKEKFIKKKIKYNKIKNYNTDLYVKEFKKIVNQGEKNKQVFTTLSNGYDSNFIFTFLNKSKYIEAFTVGGVVGRDETEAVIHNIKNISNTNLNIAYVDKKTLDHYPELIARLEGALYEKGIFLQYELLNSIQKKNLKNMVLFSGEGSDQVFSLEYYNNAFFISKCLRYILSMIKNWSWHEEFANFHLKGGFIHKFNPHQMLTYVIIKKNGILMNDINLSYIHPYLDRNIIDIAYSNRYCNKNDKNSHIKACNQEIESNIISNIQNVGGSTDPVALFENCSYIELIEKVVRKSKYNILKIKKTLTNNYLDYMLKVIYLEIFEYLFIDNYKNIDEKKKMELYDILEERLKLNYSL